MTVTTADRSEQRLVWTLVAVLTAVLAYALAGATGAGATSVVHWTGVVLLVGGICMAAAGMTGARDERMRLEYQLARARERPAELDALLPPEAAAPEVTILADRHGRLAVVVGVRTGIATVASLAGGGARLQTWGVACLIVGTILTAIW
jgi:hypothetical protein